MKVGISACLLGKECTYKGSSNKINNIEKLMEDIEFIEICPEVLGGLSTPRNPSEITSFHPLSVVSKDGVNVTKEYTKGAEISLERLKQNDVHIVLLKHRSPSCGCDGIYDGSFSHVVVKGQGVCAKLLSDNGMVLFHEEQLNEFLKYIGKEDKYGTYFKD